jgi:hypothetical protein
MIFIAVFSQIRIVSGSVLACSTQASCASFFGFAAGTDTTVSWLDKEIINVVVVAVVAASPALPAFPFPCTQILVSKTANHPFC